MYGLMSFISSGKCSFSSYLLSPHSLSQHPSPSWHEIPWVLGYQVQQQMGLKLGSSSLLQSRGLGIWLGYRGCKKMFRDWSQSPMFVRWERGNSGHKRWGPAPQTTEAAEDHCVGWPAIPVCPGLRVFLSGTWDFPCYNLDCSGKSGQLMAWPSPTTPQSKEYQIL